MNAGEFDKRITVMQHTRDADGNFAWLPIRRMWAKLTEQNSNCVYSGFAFGVQSVQINTRYTDIPCGTIISYGDNTYMVTACISDRMYTDITAARIVLIQCTLHRYASAKDELNRQRQGLNRIFSFPAVFGEKYVRPVEYITHYESARGIIVTTHKAIDLHEGDIVKTADDTYIIRACHTLDPDKNDYEAERKVDV